MTYPQSAYRVTDPWQATKISFGGVSELVGRRIHCNEAKHAPLVVDPKMREMYAELQRAAGSNINVLLLGETGVGKEVVARSLHARSRRAGGPFVAINCAALPETLLEDELFGHERGAFTGAVGVRAGLFESADGGTLFLDEIGELPLTTQAKLLRVLEDRKVVRVGGRTERNFDARFVAATNRDLEALAEIGSFRTDLYFRLASFVLTIPPLRERSSELLSLARMFLEHACSELDRVPPELAPETVVLLERHLWPGNVRELKNAMQRAAALTPGAQVLPEHLPERVRRASAAQSMSARRPGRAATSADDLSRWRGKVGDLERLTILEALDRCAGNQTRAAQELGMSRRTLLNRLETYNLPRPRR